MKGIGVLMLGLFLCPGFASDTQGSVCVAPIPVGPPKTAGIPEHLCRSGNLSFKIDSQSSTLFPHKESIKIEDLDLTQKHHVVVLCDGTPQQSFSSRFSQYQSTDLCLFINDLYQTVQLWERKGAPWCRCKSTQTRSN
jgi:hypothetical protein